MPKREFDIHQPRDDDGKWSSTLHEELIEIGSMAGSVHLALDASGEVETTITFDDEPDAPHEFGLTAEGSESFLQLMHNAKNEHARHDFPVDSIPYSEEVDNGEVNGVENLTVTVTTSGDISLYFETLGVDGAEAEGVEAEMTIEDLQDLIDGLEEVEHVAAMTGGLRAAKPRGVSVHEPDRLDVVRDVYRTAEVRATDNLPDDVLGVVSGHFSVFDTWYRIASWWEGDFVERVAPGAFAKTIQERGSSIVSAFDHGMDPMIGDKILGPFRSLKEDRTGGYYEIDLLDTSYGRDLMPGLKRRLYSASFRFQVVKDEWNNEPEASDYNPDRLPERTVKEVRLFELGPVTYPANPAATASMRSGTDSFYERLARREPARVDALRSRISSLRTLQARPARKAAPKKRSEPRVAHSGMSARDRRERLYPSLKGDSA